MKRNRGRRRNATGLPLSGRSYRPVLHSRKGAKAASQRAMTGYLRAMSVRSSQYARGVRRKNKPGRPLSSRVYRPRLPTSGRASDVAAAAYRAYMRAAQRRGKQRRRNASKHPLRRLARSARGRSRTKHYTSSYPAVWRASEKLRSVRGRRKNRGRRQAPISKRDLAALRRVVRSHTRGRKNPLTRKETAQILREARRLAKSEVAARSISDPLEREYSRGWDGGRIGALLRVVGEYGGRTWRKTHGKSGKSIRFKRERNARRNSSFLMTSRAVGLLANRKRTRVSKVAHKDWRRVMRGLGLDPNWKADRAAYRRLGRKRTRVSKRNPLLQVVGSPARLTFAGNAPKRRKRRNHAALSRSYIDARGRRRKLSRRDYAARVRDVKGGGSVPIHWRKSWVDGYGVGVASRKLRWAGGVRSNRRRRRNPVSALMGGLAGGLGMGLGVMAARKFNGRRRRNPLTRKEALKLRRVQRGLIYAAKAARKRGDEQGYKHALATANGVGIAFSHVRVLSKRPRRRRNCPGCPRGVITPQFNRPKKRKGRRVRLGRDRRGRFLKRRRNPFRGGGLLLPNRRRGRRSNRTRARRRNTGTAFRIVNGRRRRSNPPVASNPGRRRGQRIISSKIVGAAVARKYPGFKSALKGYRRFHSAKEAHYTIVRVRDGNKAVTRRAVFMVGESPALEYQTIRGQRSNKAGKPGKRIVWRHSFRDDGGKKPLLVHDPRSGISSYLGGTFHVGKWYDR